LGWPVRRGCGDRPFEGDEGLSRLSQGFENKTQPQERIGRGRRQAYRLLISPLCPRQVPQGAEGVAEACMDVRLPVPQNERAPPKRHGVRQAASLPGYRRRQIVELRFFTPSGKVGREERLSLTDPPRSQVLGRRLQCRREGGRQTRHP
jgi:hypothetical protein